MASALVLLALLVPAVLAGSPLTKELQTSQFTGFLKLLEHADLLPQIEGALSSGKALTIFAPTDDALVYQTSPTLLAFLKMKENKEALRKVLLTHIVVEKVSPFSWEGQHMTLEGKPLKLSMDASAFYAHDVAVKQYNAISYPEFSVHSMPSLIIPSELASFTKSFVEEATEVRRVLLGAMADAPAPATDIDVVPTSKEKPPVTAVPKEDATPSGAAGLAASAFTAAVALAVALF